MNAIDTQVTKLKARQKLGLMVHAVVGYPTMEKSLEIIRALVSNGSDFLELQIPFSDPVADGEIIMKACETALKSGMNTDRAFEMIESTFSHASKLEYLPIIIMCYYNQIFHYGIDKFCKKASRSNISGLIVPDIPPEEERSEQFITTCLRYGLYPIRVVSPLSSVERLKINSQFARGFVYCVSHFGVTGSQAIVNQRLIHYIKRVKQFMKLPVAVGFGLSNVEQIEKLKVVADIAIVGSAIIKNYDAGGIDKVSSFIKILKESTI